MMINMALADPRGWVFYYLICFVALLWAGFIFQQGVMLWVATLLAIIVLGFSVILLVMLIIEMKQESDETT